MAYEAEMRPVFPTAYEAEIGILDRSSMHGDRYERFKTRDDRANPGISEWHCRGCLLQSCRRTHVAHLRHYGDQAIPILQFDEGATRHTVRIYATLDGLFTTASVQAYRAVPRQ